MKKYKIIIKGDYVRVIDKGEIMATYSKRTDKTWGATKYFKYLPKKK